MKKLITSAADRSGSLHTGFLPAYQTSDHWVDSVFRKLDKSEDRWLIIRAHSNLGQDHVDGVIKYQRL